MRNEVLYVLRAILNGITAQPPSLEMLLSLPQGNPSHAPWCESWLELKFEDTYFVPLLISLLSGEALLNQIFSIPSPLTQKPSIFQDALTHPPFFTKPTPLSCNCPHHRHHHFSCSLADLPQLDAATLGFSTQEPQNCVLPETSTRIRDLSPEDIPLRSRLL